MAAADFQFILCASTGEEAGYLGAYHSIQWSTPYNGVDTVTVRASLADHAATVVTPGTSRLKIYRSSPATAGYAELVFYGWLPHEGYTVDCLANTFEATFQAPQGVLARRVTLGTESYSATDQGTIIWNLINAQNGADDTWIRSSGSLTTGTTRTMQFARGSVWDAVQQIAGVENAPTIRFTPYDGYRIGGNRIMAELTASAPSSTAQVDATFMFGEGLAQNIGNVRLSYRPAVTRATVTGSTAAGLEVTGVANDATAVTAYGRLEAYESAPDVTNQAFVTAVANGIVADLKNGGRAIELVEPSLDGPQPFDDFRVGDIIPVLVKHGPLFIDENVRVYGVDWTFQDGSYRFALTTGAV